MAYDYLGLVNEVCARLNETPLSSTNFATAAGFYRTVKDSINASLRDINHQHYDYPFNQNTIEVYLEAGIARYAIPSNAKKIDYDTIRIMRDDTLGVETTVLRPIKYIEYVKSYLDDELNTSVTGGIPKYIAKTQSNDFVLAPKPDQDYVLELEYFMHPADLVLYDDVPTVPEQFKHVIIDGAMYHSYMFRENIESANLSLNKFDAGLKQMRSLLVNEYINVTDTRIYRKGNPLTGERTF
jgi:hypothetical protein